jgi:hypothetical protein
VAILATLFALGSRFAGKVLTTALGWASTLLFGRVPAERQYLILGITFGSVIWLVLLVGVLFPAVGAFLLVLLPRQEFIPESVIRLVMLIAALIVPGIIGGLTVALAAPGERSPRRIVAGVLRGYPLTVVLSVLLIFLAALAIFRKVRSLLRRRTDAHVPVVVKPGAYERVAQDLDEALSAAGFDLAARPAPASMSKPAKWLSAVAGADAASLVPDRMLQLHGPDLDILVYPMDILISGREESVNRARAAMASRLTTSAAHLTTTGEAQAIEDRLTALLHRPEHGERPVWDEAAERELAAIDEELARIPISYEEWEVLYRERLQVERDLRVGAMAGENVLGATPVEPPGAPQAALAALGRWARAGAETVVSVATDQRAAAVLDEAARSKGGWLDRAAAVARVAAKELLGPDRDEDEARDRLGRDGRPPSAPQSRSRSGRS